MFGYLQAHESIRVQYQTTEGLVRAEERGQSVEWLQRRAGLPDGPIPRS